MLKKFGALVAVVSVLALAGCGDTKSEEEKAAIEKCLKQLETTLDEAGSDRDLTDDEIAACNDPDRRAFILDE